MCLIHPLQICNESDGSTVSDDDCDGDLESNVSTPQSSGMPSRRRGAQRPHRPAGFGPTSIRGGQDGLSSTAWDGAQSQTGRSTSSRASSRQINTVKPTIQHSMAPTNPPPADSWSGMPESGASGSRQSPQQTQGGAGSGMYGNQKQQSPQSNDFSNYFNPYTTPAMQMAASMNPFLMGMMPPYGMGMPSMMGMGMPGMGMPPLNQNKPAAGNQQQQQPFNTQNQISPGSGGYTNLPNQSPVAPNANQNMPCNDYTPSHNRPAGNSYQPNQRSGYEGGPGGGYAVNQGQSSDGYAASQSQSNSYAVNQGQASGYSTSQGQSSGDSASIGQYSGYSANPNQSARYPSNQSQYPMNQGYNGGGNTMPSGGNPMGPAAPNPLNPMANPFISNPLMSMMMMNTSMMQSMAAGMGRAAAGGGMPPYNAGGMMQQPQAPTAGGGAIRTQGRAIVGARTPSPGFNSGNTDINYNSKDATAFQDS